jgi:hypothetical protein
MALAIKPSNYLNFFRYYFFTGKCNTFPYLYCYTIIFYKMNAYMAGEVGRWIGG